MNHLHRKMAIVSLALAALTATAHAQESHVLRLALEAGKTLSVTTVSDTKMAFTGPMEQEIKTKTTMLQNYKFDKSDEGWWKFDIETADFKMEGDAGMPGMAGDPQSMIDAVKKVKLGGEVNNLGKTRNVKVAGDDSLDMMTKGMIATMAEHLTQVGFMAMVFPEAAVSVGTKWKAEFNMAKVMEANGGGFLTNAKGDVPIEFEVLGFEEVNGKKAVKVQVFSDGKVTFDSSMGGSGTMATTSKGNLWLDLATGLPIKSDTKMANNIDIGGMMNIAQEMAISTTAELK